MSVCAECKKKIGSTCCELAKGQTPTFGVTLPEIGRILQVSNRAASSCFSVDHLTPEEYLYFVGKSDVFSQVFAGRRRFRLKVVDSEDPALVKCTFLQKSGCSLPLPVRPHSCRMYPFWFERRLAKGDDTDPVYLTITNNLFPGVCYGKMMAKSDGLAMMNVFDTNKDELLKVAKAMLRDAHAHAKLVKASVVTDALGL